VADICGGGNAREVIHKWFSRKGYFNGTHIYRAECGAEMTFPPGVEEDEDAIFTHTYEGVNCSDCLKRAASWKLTGATVPENRRRDAVMATRAKR